MLYDLSSVISLLDLFKFFGIFQNAFISLELTENIFKLKEKFYVILSLKYLFDSIKIHLNTQFEFNHWFGFSLTKYFAVHMYTKICGFHVHHSRSKTNLFVDTISILKDFGLVVNACWHILCFADTFRGG